MVVGSWWLVIMYFHYLTLLNDKQRTRFAGKVKFFSYSSIKNNRTAPELTYIQYFAKILSTCDRTPNFQWKKSDRGYAVRVYVDFLQIGISPMSVTIEQDLKEILPKLNQKLDGLQKDIADLKVGQTEIKGEIKALAERINGLYERVKSQDFINREILLGLILAILGGLAKLFGFVGNS